MGGGGKKKNIFEQVVDTASAPMTEGTRAIAGATGNKDIKNATNRGLNDLNSYTAMTPQTKFLKDTGEYVTGETAKKQAAEAQRQMQDAQSEQMDAITRLNSNKAPLAIYEESQQNQTDLQKRKRLDALRRGLTSTIKTSPLGVTGSGPVLASKQLLGQ
jgi:hypothetical protein